MATPTEVRVCFASCVEASGRARLADALRGADLAIAGPHDADPRTPSVVVFETELAEALELVRSQGAHDHRHPQRNRRQPFDPGEERASLLAE